MPFTDRARIHVEAGHGGNGCLSFRREAHVPRGGPDGGNGGRGGSVRLVGDPTAEDLSRFRQGVHHRAQPGAAGEGRNRRGRDGSDLTIPVPLGTRVIRDGSPIGTVAGPGETLDVARGGQGGVGNRAFRSSTHRAPRQTVPGSPGEATWLTLELRLPVAIGLVGLPNSGKSALLRALTGARAVVAAYPHATTEPAFGNLEDGAGRLHLVADLPGLAADGAPRRPCHLEQLERASLLVHCVDAAAAEPWAARVALVREGIAPFAPAGAREVLVATRGDLGDQAPPGALRVSAESGEGVDALRVRLLAALGAAA